MGCSSSINKEVKKSQLILTTPTTKLPPTLPPKPVTPVKPVKQFNAELVLSASIIIQKWYRRYKARLDLRRRCSWKIFQEIEYSAEQDQINLYNFFNEMVANVENTGDPTNINKEFANLLGKSHLNNNNKSLTERELLTEFNGLEVEDSYKGPHVQMPITLEITENLINHFKGRKLLHSKYVKQILLEAKSKFSKLPNVSHMNLTISKQVTIVGDLHGKFLDLLTIFNKNGLPSRENPYIFNGDFVDRGKRSLEILLILCCFFLLYPDHIFLNRGNHEDYIMNSRYGFTKEITSKYKSEAGTIMDLCSTVFSWLPLATIIGNKVLVAHGGISDRTDLDKLMKVRRHLFSSVLKPTHVTIDDEEPPSLEIIREWEQILDLLWSDPQPQPGKIFNKYRGGGCCFGPDITEQILEKYQLDLLIRSHECKFEGYEYTHNDKVLTIFSVSSYYADSSNLGAYIKMNVDFKPRIIQFAVSKSSLAQRIGVNEDFATRELKDKIHSCREQLTEEFKKFDSKLTGKISVNEWSDTMERVLQMKLPWHLMRPKLVVQDVNDFILYNTLFEGLKIDSSLPQMDMLSETIYRNKQVLETVFRIIDKDCSGFISSDEFEEACHVLNNFSSIIPDKSIRDLASTLDINKDGMIDFNEFLEAFRLVSISVQEGEKGNSVSVEIDQADKTAEDTTFDKDDSTNTVESNLVDNNITS